MSPEMADIAPPLTPFVVHKNAGDNECWQGIGAWHLLIIRSPVFN
jgi:hypothetical protein